MDPLQAMVACSLKLCLETSHSMAWRNLRFGGAQTGGATEVTRFAIPQSTRPQRRHPEHVFPNKRPYSGFYKIQYFVLRPSNVNRTKKPVHKRTPHTLRGKQSGHRPIFP